MRVLEPDERTTDGWGGVFGRTVRNVDFDERGEERSEIRSGNGNGIRSIEPTKERDEGEGTRHVNGLGKRVVIKD